MPDNIIILIEVSQIRLPLKHQKSDLEKAIFKNLRVSQDKRFSWKIHRCSIDARKKGSPDIRLVYTIHVDAGLSEQSIVSRTKSSDIKIAKITVFKTAKATSKSHCQNPLIIGAGPCGYFAALYIARLVACPIILERG